ncbi:MAG TPA: zinc ribbon domain-containing protein [Nitrososphaeraceae archaeon]|nr:zinc ribbon domain-containing protein [Nitrososphaeraceae archaeon]
MSLNNKQVLINQIISMGIFFVISIAILLLLPFPISLVTIIGVFILLNFYMRNRMMRKMGMRMGGGMSGSTSSSSSMFGDNSLKYYCMSCGTQHKQAACPRCGSKMKRVGS